MYVWGCPQILLFDMKQGNYRVRCHSGNLPNDFLMSCDMSGKVQEAEVADKKPTAPCPARTLVVV